MKRIMLLWILFCLLLFCIQCSSGSSLSIARQSDDNQQLADSIDENYLRNHKTQNLIIITLDGLRWQEVFKGANSDLLFDESYHKGTRSTLEKRFWSPDMKKRKKKLLPFFWNYVDEHGKLYGNRDLGNKVDVKNPYWISYPGYNEIFTGYPDADIKTNSYGYNPNKNVLEFINEQPGYEGKVAIFTPWHTFGKRILNVKRSGLPVNGIEANKAAIETGLGQTVLEHVRTLPLYTINAPQPDQSKIIYSAAKAYLMKSHPRVLYIAFSATDHYAHSGRYDAYLAAAHNINVMIGDLWHYIQSKDFYKNKTTLFITVDHGRGIGDDWKSHGSEVANAGHPHSNEIWFVVMGPDTKPQGEVNINLRVFQNQFAATMATFLGLKFDPVHFIGDRIKTVMDRN